MTRRQLIAHLTQPSTWRGIVLLASAAGMTFRPDISEAIVSVGLALAGLIGVVTSDPVPPASEP